MTALDAERTAFMIRQFLSEEEGQHMDRFYEEVARGTMDKLLPGFASYKVSSSSRDPVVQAILLRVAGVTGILPHAAETVMLKGKAPALTETVNSLRLGL